MEGVENGPRQGGIGPDPSIWFWFRVRVFSQHIAPGVMRNQRSAPRKQKSNIGHPV